jgi:hypothetical protein
MLGGTAKDADRIDIMTALVARIVESAATDRHKRSATRPVSLQDAAFHARLEVFGQFPTPRQTALVDAIVADPEFDTATPKQIVLGASTALGKTSKTIALVKEQAERARAEGRAFQVGHFVTEHRLAAQVAADYQAVLGVGAVGHYRSPEQEHPTQPGEKMCARSETMREWTGAGMPMRDLCKGCPLKNACAHFELQALKPTVWVAPHAMLSSGTNMIAPTSGAKVFDLVIIDEGAWGDASIAGHTTDQGGRGVDQDLITCGFAGLAADKAKLEQRLAAYSIAAKKSAPAEQDGVSALMAEVVRVVQDVLRSCAQAKQPRAEKALSVYRSTVLRHRTWVTRP